MKYDLYIKNGKVVSPQNTKEAGILVKDGKIEGFVYGDDDGIEASEVIDAAGKYVLPGLIDIHVHFREPGLTYKEDFYTGSMAAACGGITTVFDMPNVKPITSTVESLRLKISEISNKAFVDYGLVGVVVADNLGELEALAAEGISNYKIFMGTTVGNIPAPMDGGIIEALRIIAGTGLRCGFHAENNDILNYYTDLLKKQGRTDPKAHVEGRPNIAEAEAISRCILYARETGCKIHIYHMSSKEGVGLVRQGKESGVDVTAETGPHYLLLDCSHMDKVGSMLKMNPPVRYPEDSSKLWEGLLDGTIEVIATDHSPHTLEEKVFDN
ncbi:MAG TPA: dihydroorotase family protein, partial [Firmicutes bacterium]|nr:dihydroorotase family protein [Bacillota bacterium]